MKLTVRLGVAVTTALLLTATLAAKETAYGMTEETAVAGPEAAAVLLGDSAEGAVVGSRAAAVLLDASQPADTQAAPSTPSSHVVNRGRTSRHETATAAR